MNSTMRILVGLCLFVVSITAWSQNLNHPSVPGIPGYLDARTGTFTPMPPAAASEEAPPVTPTTGTFVLNLTVTILSAYPGTETFSCGLSATSFEATTSLSFLDSHQVAATKSGSTLTCSFGLPYSWALTTPTTDSVTVSYTVNAVNGTTGLPTRLADHGIAHIKVPATGTTTTYTLSTVI